MCVPCGNVSGGGNLERWKVVPLEGASPGPQSAEIPEQRLIMGNVSVTNELSSRPERSVVEGPAVRLFIRSSSTCLRQVTGGMNEVYGAVFTTTTPQWKRRPPLCHPERSRGICSFNFSGAVNLSSRPQWSDLPSRASSLTPVRWWRTPSELQIPRLRSG